MCYTDEKLPYSSFNAKYFTCIFVMTLSVHYKQVVKNAILPMSFANN